MIVSLFPVNAIWVNSYGVPFVVYDPVAIASTGTPMAEPNMLAAVREHLQELGEMRPRVD